MKKLLSGLLKKKGAEAPKEPSTDAPAEDATEVPDELPPLAEDVVEKAEAAPALTAAAEAPAADTEKDLAELDKKADDTLPSLGDETTVSSDDAPASPHDLPDPIKKAKEAKTSTSGEAPIATADESPDLGSATADSEVGFFSNILKHLQTHDGLREKMLSGDLFSRMSTYWELKKHQVKKGSALPEERKLEEELEQGINELKTLEQKWQVQKMALEEDVKFLHEREREIQNKLAEVRRVSNELSLFRPVKPESYFHLYNGVILRSMHDLINALEIMEDETFHHHVTSSRNDFSAWIDNALKEKKLATKLAKTKSREEMIELLETEPLYSDKVRLDSRRHLSPKKYFWLANGVIIKSLFELSDALKAMDEGLFKQHVSNKKNDFADWAKHSLRNPDLALKLKKVQSRQEMIEVLELFI